MNNKDVITQDEENAPFSKQKNDPESELKKKVIPFCHPAFCIKFKVCWCCSYVLIKKFCTPSKSECQARCHWSSTH